MLSTAALLASIAFLALVAAAVPGLIQLTRTARSAEQTLGAFEREIRPLASQLQALLQEHRNLAQQATRDLRQVEALAARGQEVLGRVATLTSFMGSLGANSERCRDIAQLPVDLHLPPDPLNAATVIPADSQAFHLVEQC